MAKWGKCNFKDFEKLQAQLNKVARKDREALMIRCTKELAARLLTAVIKNTPTGRYGRMKIVTAKRTSKKHKKGEQYTKYVNHTGKTGGTLRRGWTSKSHEEAKNGYGNGLNNIWEALNNLKVTHEGNLYKIEIVNPVEYASYVEYGHRTANHKGWVPGKFMLTLSEDYIRSIAPQLLEQRIKEFLMQFFG